MFEAAAYLRNSLSSWSAERLQALAQFILDQVFVTVTFMGQREMAEYAYITINTRGKPLENKNIIKGHFIQLASGKSLGDANEMSRLWDALEQSAGRKLEEILRTAFLMEYREAPAFNFGAQLMEYFDDPQRLDEVFEWVGKRLPQIAGYHTQLILDLNKKSVLEKPYANIRRMNFLPWKQWQAVLFRIGERHARAPARRKGLILALDRWCFSANLLGFDDRTICDKVIRALAQIDKNVDPFGANGALHLSKEHKTRIPSRLHDGQVLDPERRGAHVRWLETLYWGETVDFTATMDASVEHVLPQRADGQWLKDFPEAIHIHAEQFGNLCLIPKTLNRDLQNLAYAQKRKAFRKLDQAYRSAHDVASATSWTMSAVHARSDRLKELALTELGFTEA